MNETEKLFNEDLRDKKKAARGVHSRKGKLGRIGAGGMRTPADLLTGKERRDYESPSPVSVSSVYDTVMPLDEFKALPRAKKMVALHEYKRRFTANDIALRWNLSPKSVYYYYRVYLKDSPSLEEKTAPEASAGNAQNRQCSFTMAGSYDGRTLGLKLEGLSKMTAGHLDYEVEIRVRELPGSRTQSADAATGF